MKNSVKGSLLGMPKFIVGFIGTLIFRLLSPFFGMWNISPLMATELAGAKFYGPLVGGIYGVLSMFLLDLIVGKVGVWTIITSITYGLVGFLGAYYLKNREANSKNFIIVSVVGTLFFDLITGVIMGPILFDQGFASAFIGQIPFTLRHLTGNVLFALVLAPWFYKKIIENPRLEISYILRVS